MDNPIRVAVMGCNGRMGKVLLEANRAKSTGARIKAYDPESMHEAGKLLTEVEFCDGPYHAIDGEGRQARDTERTVAGLRGPYVRHRRHL